MSARDRLPFGSGEDAARAAAAPALDALRGELLVLPRDEVIENHVNMMAFEQQLLSTPRFAKTRAKMPRPRRVAFVFAAVCATLASCGLSAAGALPAPLQHITESIARTLGVPQPDHTAPTRHAAAAGPTPTTSRPNVVRPVTPPPSTHHSSPASKAEPTKKKPAAKVAGKVKPAKQTPKPVVQQQIHTTPVAKAGPTAPSRRTKPRKPGHKPSNDSTNTPAGYPNDWRKLAAAATSAQLQVCAQADTLDPTGCPQIATAAGAGVQAVQWTLVNTPQPAVVIARVHQGKTGPATTVYVYMRYQMGLSYTQTGGTETYRGYSGGIAAATMTWDGSAFGNVTFSSGSAEGHLLPGVTVSPFERPAAASDGAVLAVVQAGFSLPADATSGQLTGDPTQGAVVTFDDHQGLYTVTGTYTVTATDGTATSAPYTATLYFDGQNFQIVSVAGS
jgi:hypothetical protein